MRLRTKERPNPGSAPMKKIAPAPSTLDMERIWLLRRCFLISRYRRTNQREGVTLRTSNQDSMPKTCACLSFATWEEQHTDHRFISSRSMSTDLSTEVSAHKEKTEHIGKRKPFSEKSPHEAKLSYSFSDTANKNQPQEQSRQRRAPRLRRN